MVETAVSSARSRAIGDTTAGQWFFVWMALVALGISFIGFLPTYLIPVAAGTFMRPPLVHLHGLTMLLWMALFMSQAWLAATGRMTSHRAFGMLGLALAATGLMLLVTTVVVNINEVEQIVPDAGPVLRARDAGNIIRSVVFVGLVAAGVLTTRRTDVHKRFMLIANTVILGPALGRIARVYFLGNPDVPPMPPEIRLPMGLFVLLASEALIAAAIWYDWRTRGRPHPVTLLGAALFPGLMALNVVGRVGLTDGWQSFMLWMQNVGG